MDQNRPTDVVSFVKTVSVERAVLGFAGMERTKVDSLRPCLQIHKSFLSFQIKEKKECQKYKGGNLLTSQMVQMLPKDNISVQV